MSNLGDVKLEKFSVPFFLILLVLIILSLSAAYYRYVVINDYEVFVEYDEDGELMLIE